MTPAPGDARASAGARVGGRSAAPPVLGIVLRSLAFGGPSAASEALAVVLDARPELLSVTLRTTAGGDVVADARRKESAYDGPPPARHPLDDEWVLDLPLRRGGVALGILTAVSNAPFTPELAQLLSDTASALALAASSPSVAAAQAVLDVEADLATLAAELGETVGEALVAMRHTDPAALDTAVGAALRALRQIRRELMATSLHDGLRAAVAGLRERGAVVVDAEDPALEDVGPAAGVLIERVAELACRNAVRPTRITLLVDGHMVKLRVLSADNAVDASELARWQRRAAALHGELRHWPGGVELTLPTHP